MQATEELQGSIHAFANNINTREGGTHLTGFKTALTRVVNDYARSNNLLDDLDSLKGDDIREGLTAVISVKHPDPQFEGQTKTKLGNSEVRGIVESVTHEQLGTYFEENPGTAQAIVMKAVEAAKARRAAKKAEELTRRKSALESTALPGNWPTARAGTPTKPNCSSSRVTPRAARKTGPRPEVPGNFAHQREDSERRETPSGPHSREQRGPGAHHRSGAGIGDEFDIDDLRYETIILMTDADVDGAHIRTLLLTLFYRHMKPLLEAGYVYASQPPLYRIRYRGNTYDAMTDAERDRSSRRSATGTRRKSSGSRVSAR